MKMAIHSIKSGNGNERFPYYQCVNDFNLMFLRIANDGLCGIVSRSAIHSGRRATGAAKIESNYRRPV